MKIVEAAKRKLFVYFISLSVLWIALIAILAFINYQEIYNSSLQIVKSSAIVSYNKDLVYRRWATIHGGVYVPISPGTPPNPWLLNLPERDISTPSGKKLTLINPAYMTRQVQELGVEQFGLIGHITSLKPLRSSNSPDNWEREALTAFEQGVPESASLALIEGKEFFRFMRPIMVEPGCLKCHSQQGYKIGDIRGGISVSVPWEPVREQLNIHLIFIFLTYGGIWAIGIAGAIFILKRILKDLRRQKKMEDDIRESEQKYRSLFDSMNQGMALHEIILDQSGKAIDYRFVEANDSFEKITGLARKDVIGKTVLEIMPGTEKIWIEKYGQVVATGKAIHYENYAMELQKYYDVVAYRPQSGQFAVIISDVTDRRHNEEQIIQKNEELQKINAEKDKFFSIVAHDLRSPFNGFLGLTQLMAEELSDMSQDDIQKMAISMKNSAANLFRLLGNLLEWSLLQQGLLSFNREEVPLLPIIEESICLALDPAKIKGVEITFDCPAGITVYADVNMLKTIIRNILSNAVKFTPKGGTISLSAQSAGDNSTEISIKDTGIGMDSAMVDDLFRIDVQTSRKGTAGEPSTGLGLILCKEFIEKHGGKLWVVSQQGKGSTFRFAISNQNQ